MFVEENNRIFVVEDNQIVASFVKEAYYGSCPHPDCEEHGKHKYDLKKNENCKSCGTSMKIEFPKTKKKDSEEKEVSSEKKESASKNEDTQVLDWRTEQLERLGFSKQDAEELADNREVDVREIEAILEKGATHDQAKRIIAKIKGSSMEKLTELDPIGEEDEDVDNDGNTDSTDSYLKHRREVIEDKTESGEDKEEDEEEDEEEEETSRESSVKEALADALVECDRCGKNADCHKQGGEWVCDECANKTASLAKGSRVSHREKEGTVISIVPGLYGDTYGVKFDNGNVVEFLADQLAPVESAAPIYLSSVDAINADYIDYEVVPANTYDELEEKTRIARSLNLRAKTLILDSKISMNDRVKLDEIITSTSADIRDFKEGQLHLQEIEQSAYLARSPKYKINDEFIGWGSQARTKTDEDISWVSDIDSEFESADDATLVSLASEAIKSLSREQLQDENFIEEVKYYNTLKLPNEVAPRFAKFLREAVSMKLAEPVEKVAKTSSVESFDDVADEALFM